MARRAGGVQAWVEQGERCRPTAIVRTGVVLGGDAWGGCAHWVPLLRRNAFARKGGVRRVVARLGWLDGGGDACLVSTSSYATGEAFLGLSVVLVERPLPAARHQSGDGREYVAKRLSEEEL